MLTEDHKDRLAAHARRVHNEYEYRIVPDPAHPGTRPASDEELAAAMYGGLNAEEVEYVRSLSASKAAQLAEALEAYQAYVEEKYPDGEPDDDPVIKRIDDSGIAD